MKKTMPFRLAAALVVLCCVDRTVAQQPNPAADAEITFNTGLTHLREGRTELAIESFKKAIKQDPKNAYFYKGLGVAYTQLSGKCPQSDAKCRQEKSNEAVLMARKALELNPYYVDARNDLGAALILSGRREEGKKELLAAYEDPTNPTPELSARNLGQAYFEERNYVQAEVWFQTCVTRNKSYPEAYIFLAEALIAQNKVAEAIERLELGQKNALEDPSLWVALGQAYYRAGRFSEARQQLEKAASKDPAGPSGRRALELLRNFPR